MPAEPNRTQQLPLDATGYIPPRRNDEHHSTTDDHSDFTPQMPLDITRSPQRSHHRSYQHPLPPRSTSALCLMYVLGDAVAVHFAYSRQRSAGIERGGSQGVGMQLYGRRPVITLQYSYLCNTHQLRVISCLSSAASHQLPLISCLSSCAHPLRPSTPSQPHTFALHPHLICSLFVPPTDPSLNPTFALATHQDPEVHPHPHPPAANYSYLASQVTYTPLHAMESGEPRSPRGHRNHGVLG